MSNESYVKEYLKDKGLNDMAIAGIMGNIQAESGFDSSAENSSSGAYGLFQWLGSRKKSLKKFAAENGADMSDIETQMDFFWNELQTTEKSTYKAMTGDLYDSPEQYATAFEKLFERSGGALLEKRQNYAQAFYSGDMAEDVETGNTSPGNKMKNASELVWWGDIVKVVLIFGLIVGGVVLLAVSAKTTAWEVL